MVRLENLREERAGLGGVKKETESSFLAPGPLQRSEAGGCDEAVVAGSSCWVYLTRFPLDRTSDPEDSQKRANDSNEKKKEKIQ